MSVKKPETLEPLNSESLGPTPKPSKTPYKPQNMFLTLKPFTLNPKPSKPRNKNTFTRPPASREPPGAALASQPFGGSVTREFLKESPNSRGALTGILQRTLKGSLEGTLKGILEGSKSDDDTFMR